MAADKVLRVEIVGDEKALAATFRRASAEADSFAGRMAATGRKITSVGHTLTRDLTLPIVGLGVVATKMALDFDQKMTMLQTQAGASAKEVQRMHDAVLQLAHVTPQGPNELADALYHIESVGYRGAAALKVLRAASQGAMVGNARLEDVTYALVSAVNTHIKGTETATKAMALLNATVGQGDMRMQDLTSALSTGVLPVAKAVGLKLLDVSSALEVLTDRGVPAEEAATRLRMTFALMESPSNKAKAALKELGLSSDTVALAMRTSLPTAIQILHDHMMAIQDPVKRTQLLLQAFGGGRSASAILTLVQNVDTLKRKYEETAAGASRFGAQVAAAQDLPINKLHVAWSSIQSDLIRTGEGLAPVAVEFADFFANIVHGFEELDPHTQHLIVELAGIAAALGPGLTITGRLIGSFRTLYGLMGSIGKIGGGGAGMGTAITLGISGLVGGFLYLSGRENDFQRANDNLRRSLELLGGDLNHTASLVRNLGDAEARLPTDALAVHTSQLAVAEQRAAVAHDHHGQAMLRLVDAYQKGNISETQLIENAGRIHGLSLSERGDLSNLISSLDGLRLARRTEAGDAGQAAAYKKAVARSEAQTWQQLADVRQRVADASKTALAEEQAALRAHFGATDSELKKLAQESPAVAQAIRAGPVLAARELADNLQKDAAASAKVNPTVAAMTQKLSEYVRVTGRVPKKVEVNYILDPKHAKESLAQIMAALNTHVTTAGRLAMTGGDKIATGFLSATGKFTTGLARTLAKVPAAVNKTASGVSKAGPVAYSAGEKAGERGGKGMAAGILSQVHAVAAAAAQLAVDAFAAAGAMQHGSGPWQSTIHTVGKPMGEGVAIGIRSTTGLVADAISDTVGGAAREGAYIDAAGKIVGADVARSIAAGIEGKQISTRQQVINTMRAASATRGDIDQAAKILGRHQAEMIAAGVLGYQPSLAAQIRQQLRDAIKQAMDAAKQQVDSGVQALNSALSAIGSNITSAADALGPDFGTSNKQGTGGRDLARKAQAEKDALAARQQQEQLDQLTRAAADAQNRLNADIASGADQTTIDADKQAIADANQQLQDYKDQLQADADAKAAADQQKRDKDNLEKQWNALQREIKAHPERAAKIRREIDQLLAKYGITPDSLQAHTDWATAQTLFVSSMGDLVGAMKALTVATDKLAGIQAKASGAAPASGSMPHAASGGIYTHVPGGVIRVLEGGHDEGIVTFDPGKRTRSLAVWAEIGKRLNVPGFEHGGITDTSNYLNDSDYAKALRDMHGKWPKGVKTPGLQGTLHQIYKAWNSQYSGGGGITLPDGTSIGGGGGGRLHWEAAWPQALAAAIMAGKVGTSGNAVLARPPGSISDRTWGQIWYDFPGGSWPPPKAGNSLGGGPGGSGVDPGNKFAIGLADGGIVRRRTFAEIAEREPEIVAPLSALAGAGGGDTHIHIHTHGPVYGGNKRRIAEELAADIDDVLRRRRRNGLPSFDS